ncbi:MAG TPA: DUF3037 domain-containing protein [Verrucomicrobiae bacterium]|nr:DUF3037 domain-containing protein [Verrucomicrobiae bacterium]
MHDVVTAEFVNIGTVLYGPEQRFLKARFAKSCQRLKAMFLQIDHLHFGELMRCMEDGFERMDAQIQNSAAVPPASSLAEMVKRILSSDDSSLQWSKEGGGFTDDPEKTLKQLFNRFVERYQPAAECELQSQF